MLVRSFGLALLLPALAGCFINDPLPAPPGSPEDLGPLGERADLPIDERLTVDNLTGKVDVVRDQWGRPHIYATSVADAMRVEGYLVAVDRSVQMEFYRRVSEGRVAEILSDASADAIDQDIALRHVGLARAAEAQWQALPEGEVRGALEAFADGVTQAFRKIRSGEIRLPSGLLGLDKSAFTDWTPVDSLAIGRLQTYLLSYDADSDVGNQLFFDAARSTFTAADADPEIARRAGLLRDLFRFAPADPTTTIAGYPSQSAAKRVTPSPARRVARDKKPAVSLAPATRYLDAMRSFRGQFTRAGFGSNNWAVAAERSATGHALVASDPHLSLTSPSVFWPVSLDVRSADGDAAKDLVAAGIAFPGIPAIILGHNRNVAWGATVAGYDVSDAFAETLTADGSAVVFQGKEVKLETIDEVIKLQNGESITYRVQVVPHHGPLLPTIDADHHVLPADPAAGAVSIRWTGMKPTRELEAVFGLLRASNVREAREALNGFGVGAQNWMLGDTSGDIAWTSHAQVPVRDPRAFQWDAATYQGTLPCLVLPGDGTAEWTSFLDDGLVPWAESPSTGILSTANNDPIGDTVDNDPSNDTLPDGSPMFLACSFDIGFRQGKIQGRLGAHKEPLAPADLASIQGDERSSMGAALAPLLIAAIERGIEEHATPGKHPDISGVASDPGWDPATLKTIRDLLVDWGKDHGYAAASGVSHDDNTPLPESGDTAAEVKSAQATLLFNAWLVRVMNRTFGDELDRMQARLGREPKAKALLHLMLSDPASLATYDAKTGDSAIWDDLATPGVQESRRERVLRALLDALGDLGPDVASYRWGARHTLRFGALLPFWGLLSIPSTGDGVFVNGFPRHGDSFSVDASDYSFVSGAAPLDFSYGAGPTQRFVVDMDPQGPRVDNALPGGAVWNPQSPHFRDEAELWRRNQTHPVPFLLDDVIAAKESRTLVSP